MAPTRSDIKTLVNFAASYGKVEALLALQEIAHSPEEFIEMIACSAQSALRLNTAAPVLDFLLELKPCPPEVPAALNAQLFGLTKSVRADSVWSTELQSAIRIALALKSRKLLNADAVRPLAVQVKSNSLPLARRHSESLIEELCVALRQDEG